MKKPILFTILVLCSLGLFGQNDSIMQVDGVDTTWFVLPQIQGVYTYNSASPTTPTEDELFRLLNKYSTECYNDSTVTTMQIACPEGRVGCLVYHERKEVVHRKPTFTGFIEWLRERQR